MSHSDPNRWWKGSLPSWMGVALITVTMFAGRRLLTEHDRLIEQVGILGNRVVALEAKVQAVQVALALDPRPHSPNPNPK